MIPHVLFFNTSTNENVFPSALFWMVCAICRDSAIAIMPTFSGRMYTGRQMSRALCRPRWPTRLRSQPLPCTPSQLCIMPALLQIAGRPLISFVTCTPRCFGAPPWHVLFA